jgi:XFP C-terminal domain
VAAPSGRHPSRIAGFYAVGAPPFATLGLVFGRECSLQVALSAVRLGTPTDADRGCPSLTHRLTYRRTNDHNFHVRSYMVEGTTTTPFDIAMLNDLDRIHLVMDVKDRVPGLRERAAHLRQEIVDALLRAPAYARGFGDDLPEVRDWTWPRWET